VKSTEDARAGCRACRHFFVSYDAHFPYGCRILGFKTRRMPCFDVRDASGADCQSQEAKDIASPVKPNRA
jgi:hypothetical protein